MVEVTATAADEEEASRGEELVRLSPESTSPHTPSASHCETQ